MNKNGFSEKLGWCNLCGESCIFRNMSRYWLNQIGVPPVLKYGWQKVIWPWIEKNMGKTQIRKDCPSVGVSMTLFWSCSVGRFVSSFLPKAFLFLNLTCIGGHIPLLQGYSLWKSLTIIFQSIWTLYVL